MTRLFSPFDLGYYSFVFLFSLLRISLLLGRLHLVASFLILLLRLKTYLINFFCSLKPKGMNKFSRFLFFSIFLFLFLVNFLSVFSYNFPVTSQVSAVLFFSLASWLSLTSFSLIKNFKGFISHLIPEGTPIGLTSLLFLIELVSRIIRPITLMVRLVANILAGHLLICLLSSLVFIFPYSLFLYVILNVVELFVAIIQSYIFSTIVVLYFSEV